MTKVSDKTILAALDVYDSAADVVAATGAPLRRVIYLQRLYGPALIQLQRATEDHNRHMKALEGDAGAGTSNPEGPCPTRKKLESAQAAYWRRFEGIPDGPADFDGYLESMIEGLRRRRGGRVAS